ncbi:MAG: hypothetical protein LBL45_05720 [Treponema sp.]|jgi:hypothetical protein|nr:hypothetical protein [Treponema sp.]
MIFYEGLYIRRYAVHRIFGGCGMLADFRHPQGETLARRAVWRNALFSAFLCSFFQPPMEKIHNRFDVSPIYLLYDPFNGKSIFATLIGIFPPTSKNVCTQAFAICGGPSKNVLRVPQRIFIMHHYVLSKIFYSHKCKFLYRFMF